MKSFVNARPSRRVGRRLGHGLLLGGALLLAAPGWAQAPASTPVPAPAPPPAPPPARPPLTGRVAEADGLLAPLPGASVFWLGTKLGTAADAVGHFSLAYPTTPPPWRLVVKFLGLRADTLRLTAPAAALLTVGLRSLNSLGEARVVGQREAHSATSVGQMETISTRDLTKSACCNLAESFETNAAVEVSTTDAVSGAKQIQLLGLDGAYSLLTVDNQPALRGLASPYRLNYLAGPWIEAIDIIKGTGSVVNGYEGISGQVNVHLKASDKAERLHLNVYANDLGKTDYNVVAATPLTARTSAEVLLHADHLGHRADRNADGFLDLPLATQFNGLAKWKYKDGTHWMVELGGGALRETRRAGQLTFGRAEDPLTSAAYGVTSLTDRLTGFGRASYTFPGRPYQTLGVLANLTDHAFTSAYGRRTYTGRQTTAQATVLMQGIFGTTAHVWKTGVSFLHDDVRETLTSLPRVRRERVPGSFAEYTYQDSRRLTAVAGLRFDQHNLYGPVWTPRLSVKYDFTPETVLRLSGGTGFRVANPVAENAYALTSSRAIIVLDAALRPERARNLGGSLTRYFAWHGRAGALILDYYHTAFTQQVIADMYTTPDALTFSNLRSSSNPRGKSMAQSGQVEAHYEVVKGLQAKAAWKWYDVRSDYPGGYELPRALLPRYRAFVNLAYASAFDKWRFDLTTQWYGQRPLPGLDHGAVHHDPAAPTTPPPMRTTPRFALLNAQATRAFRQLEVYVGVENLLNYRQPDPIVAANAPFGPGFDAGMVWGPVFGRLTYAGLRYTLK